MTLAELSQYICTKVGQTDDDSAAACQLFLRRRYNQIWDAALWKESLYLKAIPTLTGVCVLPATCDQVVAVRVSDQPLSPLDQTTLMHYDPGAYVRTGRAPTGFVYLSPTCVSAPIDGSTVITVHSSSALDNAQSIHFIGETDDGVEVRESLPLAGTTPVQTVNGFENVLSAVLSAPCLGDVTVISAGPDFIVAGRLSLEPRPRVQVLETASGLAIYTFLCKRRYTDLLEENDMPLLRNCDNALLAFATADMLERQRQYGKAQAKLAEAQAQMQIMLDLERNQSASEQRIIPADLHGSPVAAGFGAFGKGAW